jgi:hypothetical protein
MRDPELVARAQRAAARLESAWERWRELHGLAVAPGQPVVSYVGYSLKEPWGEPRVVIGIDADEAEFLADFLDRDECVRTGQQPMLAESPQPSDSLRSSGRALGRSPVSQLDLRSSGGAGGRPPVSQQGDYTSPALLGAPVSLGIPRQAPGSDTGIAAELAGWSAGELPGQASEHLAGWPPTMTPPGLKAIADQPPGSV